MVRDDTKPLREELLCKTPMPDFESRPTERRARRGRNPAEGDEYSDDEKAFMKENFDNTSKESEEATTTATPPAPLGGIKL